MTIYTLDNMWQVQPTTGEIGENTNKILISNDVLWNFALQIDRRIKANKPNIITKDLQERMCFLPEVTIPVDANISDKLFNKVQAHRKLKIQNI